MTQTAASTPDTNITPPENPSAPPDPGPPRSGHPRGNPNLAPRCGAKARTTGCRCRAPAMPNGRCRMHGGKSTGPRTPKGFADLAEARTKHGLYTAAARATYCYRRKLATRTRTVVAVLQLRACLPSELEARIAQGPYELVPPPRPDAAPVAGNQDNTPCNVARTAPARDANGRFLARARPAPTGRQAEREAARQERAMLAPWRAGIKRARLIKRLLKYQDQNARRAQRARASLPSPPPGPSLDAGTQRPVGLTTARGSMAGPCHDVTPEPQPQRENPNQDHATSHGAAVRESRPRHHATSRGAAAREPQPRPHATLHRAAARESQPRRHTAPRGAAIRESRPRPHATSRGAAVRESRPAPHTTSHGATPRRAG